jgi:hypothetical protein
MTRRLSAIIKQDSDNLADFICLPNLTVNGCMDEVSCIVCVATTVPAAFIPINLAVAPAALPDPTRIDIPATRVENWKAAGSEAVVPSASET